MPQAQVPPPPLGVMRLVTGSFQTLLAHFGFLFPLVLAPTLALAALTYVLVPTPAGVADAIPALTPAVVAALVANLLIGFVIGGVLCLASLDALLGKRHGIGDYVRQTLRQLAPLMVLGALVWIAAVLGLALFIVPGLYVFARFAPLTPVVLFENAGWPSLGRAQSLTEGYRWPIAGAILLLGLAAFLLGFAPAFLLSLAIDSPVVGLLVEFLLQVAGYLLGAIFMAQIYLRLREIKDGETRAEIAASIG